MTIFQNKPISVTRPLQCMVDVFFIHITNIFALNAEAS